MFIHRLLLAATLAISSAAAHAQWNQQRGGSYNNPYNNPYGDYMGDDRPQRPAWVDVVDQIGAAVIQGAIKESQNNAPQPVTPFQPVRPPSQPPYRPWPREPVYQPQRPYYPPTHEAYRPVTPPQTIHRVTPAPQTVTRVAPAKNALPSFRAKPQRNHFTSFSSPDAAQLDKLAEGLNEQLGDDARKLQVEQDQRIDDLLQAALASQTGAILSPVENEQLRHAILDRDLKKIEELTRGSSMNPAVVKDLVDQVRVGKSFDDLVSGVQAGGTAAEIQPLADQLRKDILASGAGPAAKEQQLEKVAGLTTLAESRDTLVSVSLGGGGPGAITQINSGGFPPGSIPVITVPEWPQGTVSGLPGGPMIVGTGGVGELGLGVGIAAEVLGMAAPAGDPIPDNEGAMDSGIVLRSDRDCPGDVNYTLNGHRYTMKPGYSQKVDASRAWTIEFDRGGSYGNHRQELSAGTFKFSVDQNGWRLARQSYSATIDNKENRNAFHFLANGEPRTVAAHASLELTGDYPLFIEFDSGNNGPPVKKKLTGGAFQVGLDMKQQKIELYPAKETIAAAGPGPQRPVPRISSLQ